MSVFADLPQQYYRSIAIDPPWHFSGGTTGRPQHYDRMRDPEIAALPVRDLAHPNGCHLFMWVTSPKLDAPVRSTSRLSPFAIARAWGFRYSGRAFIWVKTERADTDPLFVFANGLHTGTGYTTRKNAEDVLLFKRGKPQRLSKAIHEIILAPIREHSRKPDEFYRRVERYCAGPHLEVFARESRPGWDTWGNEAEKFDVPRLPMAAE